MADQNNEARAWFMRVAIAVIKDPRIMRDASATDWRVLLAICQHQGWSRQYRYRKTLRISIARTANEAHCSRRAAFRSISWWCKMGALRKTKEHRMNVYEIMPTLVPSSGIDAAPRHYTTRAQKRDRRGRYVPSAVADKMPAHGTDVVPAHGTQNEKSLTRSILRDLLPSPPGGDGRSSEAASRPAFIISEKTIRELLKTKTKGEVLELLHKGGYPVPPFLLTEEGGHV